MDCPGENSENSLVFIPFLLHFHEKHIPSEALKHTLEPNIRNKMSFKRRSLEITCAITSSIVLAGISGTAAAQSSYVSGSSGLLSSSELHPETPAPLDAPKNIIYMIGDGMVTTMFPQPTCLKPARPCTRSKASQVLSPQLRVALQFRHSRARSGPSLHSPPSRMETPTTLSARGLITTMSMRTSPTPLLQEPQWQPALRPPTA
ncbi:alkaline phosphatase [Corynebacterium glutamicum]|nr:alkaline phosphatase [Corynebacterium glutamicum]